jgi:hypothetical protein
MEDQAKLNLCTNLLEEVVDKTVRGVRWSPNLLKAKAKKISNNISRLSYIILFETKVLNK